MSGDCTVDEPVAHLFAKNFIARDPDIVHEIDSIPLEALGWRIPLEAFQEKMEKLHSDDIDSGVMLQ